MVDNVQEPGRLADLITSNMRLTAEKRQLVLSELNVLHRLELVNRFLNEELEILKLGAKIQSQIQDDMEKAHSSG